MRPVTEPIIGTQDGINTIFETSATYVPTTVYYYINGQLMPKENVTELGGKRFEIFEAPEADDDLQVRYTAVV